MNDRVLVVQDDDATAASVAYALRAEGYEADIATDGFAGLEAVIMFGPDLIILDLMLPGLSGAEFILQAREKTGVPIIVLSVKNEEIDKVLALELGADDYVTKPFGMPELVARVKALLRRTREELAIKDQQTRFAAGRIEMDLARRTVTVNGREVYLPLKQFELLRLLIANNYRVVSRSEIIKALWGLDADVDAHSETLSVHVRWLRERIEENPSRPAYVRTVRGAGFRLADVCEE